MQVHCSDYSHEKKNLNAIANALRLQLDYFKEKADTQESEWKKKEDAWIEEKDAWIEEKDACTRNLQEKDLQIQKHIAELEELRSLNRELQHIAVNNLEKVNGM